NLLDWSMAYCQSQLYVEYLTKTHGPGAVGDLLEAYRDGLDTAEAIRKVCKVEKAEFEKGYRRHLEEVVKKLGGKPDEKPMSFSELRAAFKEKPGDLDVMARLAEEYLRRDRAEARKLAGQVLDKKGKHPRASYVMARLEALGGNTEKARALLEGAVDRAAPDVQVLKALGKLYYDGAELKKAAEILERGGRAAPYEKGWLEQLAGVYARTEERDKQVEVLKELVKGDADDLEARKRLARLLQRAGKPAEAEKYAR